MRREREREKERERERERKVALGLERCTSTHVASIGSRWETDECRSFLLPPGVWREDAVISGSIVAKGESYKKRKISRKIEPETNVV